MSKWQLNRMMSFYLIAHIDFYSIQKFHANLSICFLRQEEAEMDYE